MSQSTQDAVSPQPRLSLRGRYFFLTYPRCGFNHSAAWILLQDTGATGAIIATELHQDGEEHVHIAVDYGRRRQFSDARATFTLTLLGRTHTGNYQACRSWAAVRAYVEKDGRITYWGTAEPAAERTPETETADILEAVATLSYTHYLVWALQQKIPFAYASAFWNDGRASKPSTLLNNDNILGTITVPELLMRHFDVTTNRALVIVGPSGCGKTTWAKLNIPKPALMVSHVDDLKHFNEGYHKGIVFDDMHFAGDENGKGAWPRTSQIHLVDFENPRSIHCRHRCAYIPAGIFKIFTANVFPFTDDPAIQRRIYTININII